MATHRRSGTTGMTVDPVDVLVVGAGPTGLALALQADALGARVRVVERRREPFRHSRALVLHPRSLEVLRPLGVNDALLERAHLTPSVCLHLGDRQVWLHTADLGLEGSAYPSPVLIRQADVEAVLASLLTARGVVVERGAEAIDVAEGPEFSSAVVRTARGDERIECRFLVGCDGAASTVRGCAGIGYRGGSYGQDVLLADVELTGDIAPSSGAFHR